MGSVLESPPSTKEFQENLPYWQVNVPVAEREEECPGFLRNVAPKDQEILSTPQSAYHLMPWSELSEHIKNNRLDIFQRTPLDLRKYCAFNYSVVQQYGSILDFIQKVKLHWDSPIVAKKAPFEEEEDIKVQWNDWPYGIQEGVVHLVVWVKFAFEEERPNGDLSERERKRIDGFVEERFRKKLGAEKVLWFRNWSALKSVHSIEHFHVMLLDPGQEFLDEVTGFDVPMFKKKEFGGTE